MSFSLPNQRDVETWNVEQVAAYIQQMQIGDCQQAFLKRGIHGRAFLNLSEVSLMYGFNDISRMSQSKIARLVNDIKNQGTGSKSRGGIFTGADVPDPNFSDDEDNEDAQSQLANRRGPVEDQDGYLTASNTTQNENNVYEPMEDARLEPGPSQRPAGLVNPPKLPPRNQSAGGSDGRPNSGVPTGSVGRLSSNQAQHFKQAPKRSFSPVDPTTKQQQVPFNVPTRFPSANAGSAIAPSPAVPGGAFKLPSVTAPAPGGVVTGGSGGGLPPRRLLPSHFNSQSTSADASGGASVQDFQAQLNAQVTGKKLPPHPALFHASSPIKGVSSAGMQIPLKTANFGGVVHGGDVTPAPLQHVAGGISGLQKAIPGLPPLPASSDSFMHTARANPTLPGGITCVRRPGLENKGAMPPMAVTTLSTGPQMSSRVTRPGNEYTPLEGVNECHHQESVRLGNDGPRIVLTPLYKSLVQQHFFHLVTRENAETLLNGCSGGSFLVRPSTRGHPLTLMLTHQGSFCNIGIRHRSDGLFALGAEKLHEKTFNSVEELIEFYSKNLLKLNTGGEVQLTNSPAHDATHIYIRVPIKNGFPVNRERNES